MCRSRRGASGTRRAFHALARLCTGPPSGSDRSQYREGRPVTGSGRLARVQPGEAAAVLTQLAGSGGIFAHHLNVRLS
jgi:hypothetical protein